MPARRGLLAPQNTFLDTIATRFDGTHSNFVLGNAQVPSLYPIVYCSDGFCELTGYARAQIMQKGCACKFLYGPETLDENKMAIDNALETKSELKIEVMFYKKSGVPFWCLLDIVPIKNEKREVVLFLASHKDITHTKMAEITPYSSMESEENESIDPEDPPANYGRRRSRAVLYQLSGHYKQDNIKSKLKINNNLLQPHSAGPLPEYKTASIKKSRLILTHYGMFKTCWDLVILLATIYVAVTVPYNAAFLQDKPTLVPDMVVEALFIVDIILNFRTTFVNKKGEVILCPRLIALNYMRGWFLLDLIAAMPFDMLLAANKLTLAKHNIYMLKLTRLLRLLRLLQKMDRYSQYSAFILTLLMLFFSLVSHWLACIWYAIAEREMEIEKTANITDEYRGELRGGWVFELAERFDLNDTACVGTTEKYVTALYFTCSMLTSVGFGNVSANTKLEKIFAIVTMLIGALMHATVFGNVTSIIQRMYSRRSLYQTKWRDLKDFLTLNQIPKELKHRMQDYFQTMWSLNQGIDSHETLKEFPEELRGDISMHIHREILSLPIFENAAQGCLKLLSLHIRNNFCAPGEYLVHKGDAVQYIYYLCNGSMEVVMDDMVVAILGKGDLVGSDIDVHLQNGFETIVKSSCDVKALTYCDLKTVNIFGLVDVLKLYPEYQQEFAHDIKHDLTHNLREGYDGEDKEFDIISAKNLLPSISEDDEERGSDEDDKSPVSTSPRSPLHPRTPSRFNFNRNEDETSSPRWGHRQRDRMRTSDRLKALSPTRLHRSSDELRGDSNAKVQLEKIDSQVTTLHSDVNLLTHEVRSAVQLLQSLNRDSQEIMRSTRVSPISARDVICVGGRVQHSISGGPVLDDMARSSLPFTRSSPSVFVTDTNPPTNVGTLSVSPSTPHRVLCPAPPSTPCSPIRKEMTINVATQTELPINVPIAVLEAFVLAHRSRVLQLLGVVDPILSSHNISQPMASHDDKMRMEHVKQQPYGQCMGGSTEVFSYSIRKGSDLLKSSSQSSVNSPSDYIPILSMADVAPCSSISPSPSPHSTASTPSDNYSSQSDHHVKICDDLEPLNHYLLDQSAESSYMSTDPSSSVPLSCSQFPKSGVNNNNNHNKQKAESTLSGTYQICDVQNWDPQPVRNNLHPNLPSSISAGSIKEILRYSCPHYSAQVPYGALQESINPNVPINQSKPEWISHNECTSNCDPNDLLCFSEVSARGMSRSTSLPVPVAKTNHVPLANPLTINHLEVKCEDDSKDFSATRSLCVTDF